MPKSMIRRCGECAYLKEMPFWGGFLRLGCASPHSEHQGKRRNRGYFGCRQHYYTLEYLRDLSR